MNLEQENNNKKVSAKGECWVWLNSMGLALGIFMVLGLLAVIFKNGITVFWPKPVYEIELVTNSPTTSNEGQKLFGSITMDRVIASSGEDPKFEYQFFTGNKDLYGFMYKFIPKKEIKNLSQPKEIMVGERLEYGNAIFLPNAIEFPDGRILEHTDASFKTELFTTIETCNDRREEIYHLEKKEIGSLNTKIEKLSVKKRNLLADEGEQVSETAMFQKITKEEESLRTQYDKLAEEATELREMQESVLLHYRLISGEENTLPVGHFVEIYYPNQLSFGDKVIFFIHHFWSFLSENPREANTEGGIFPAIFGTFVMTLIMSVAVMPFGVVAAIYLREYAKQGPFVRAVRIAVNNLAGVPSIVFGVFGLGFFVYFMGSTIDSLFFSDYLPTPTFGTGGILWASLTLALMTVPVVVVATEEALAAVPRGAREASLACGASKWQTIQRIVLPASAPGILTGLILAMARGAGEVAPLMLVGVVKLAPELPLDFTFPFMHLDRKFMHLGFHIYDLGFQSPDSEAAKPMVFATTFLLIVLVVLMNLGAITVRNHLRKKYATSTF